MTQTVAGAEDGGDGNGQAGASVSQSQPEGKLVRNKDILKWQLRPDNWRKTKCIVSAGPMVYSIDHPPPPPLTVGQNMEIIYFWLKCADFVWRERICMKKERKKYLCLKLTFNRISNFQNPFNGSKFTPFFLLFTKIYSRMHRRYIG